MRCGIWYGSSRWSCCECGTDENPADLLTKAVASKAKFDKFAKWIMGYVDESVLAFMLQCRRRVVTGSDL